MIHGVLRTVDTRHQIDVYDGTPLLGSQARERPGNHAADVVDENVEPTQGLGCSFDELTTTVFAGEIDGDPNDFYAQGLEARDGLFESLLVARG